MIRTLYYIFVKTVINFFVIAEKIVRWIVFLLLFLLLCRFGCDLFLSLTDKEVVPSWVCCIIYFISVILMYCISSILSFFHFDEPFTDKLFGKWWFRYQAFDYTWRNKVAWVNAICLFVIAIIGWLMVFVFDTEFTRIAYKGMLACIHLLSRSLGIGYKPTLLALFYGNFFVKVLSCMMLLFALLHNRSHRNNALIFTRSGLCCILFYVCSIGYDCFNSVSEIFLEGIEQQCACIYDYLLEYAYVDSHSMAYEVFNILLVPTIYTLTLNVILFAYIWNYEGGSCDDEDDEEYSNYKLSIATIDDKALFRLVMMRTFYSVYVLSSVCKKRIKQLTKNFDIEYMSHLTAEEENALLQSNQRKTFSQRLHAAVVNASLFTGLQQEYGSFILYICSITHTEEEQIKQPCTDKVLSVRAAILANDLRFRGFKYIGEAAAIDILMTLQRSLKKRKHLNEFRLFNKEK